MKEFFENNFKDARPLDTINTIRKLLGNCGLNPIETNWKSSSKNYHSVHLRIPELNMFSNGKGINRELALASAYGEFIERFQNQAMYRVSIEFSQNVEDAYGFYYSPDENYYSIDELLEGKRDERVFIPDCAQVHIDDDKIDQWLLYSPKCKRDKILAVPYYNATDCKIEDIPIAALSLFYGTNGMCAGNSPEEALVEGIAEIFERYAILEVLENGVIPPTIPRSFLKNYARQYAMIETLEEMSGYEVIVKDCSLGKGLPVVGIIIVDKKLQKYVWSFGSHPHFDIALERTLTESLQGSDLFNFTKLQDFSYIKNEEINSKKNKLEILRCGQGVYDAKTFSNKFSYEFRPFEKLYFESNKEMLDFMIGIVDYMGEKVYIRDVSFMGFPSYHVVISNMADILDPDDTFVQKTLDEMSVKSIVRDLDSSSKNDIETVLSYVERYFDSDEDSLGDIIGAPVNLIFPWYKITRRLFLSTLYWRLGNKASSYEEISKYIEIVSEKKEMDSETLTWYKCIRDYMGTRIKEEPKDDALEVMKLFYEEELISSVVKYIDNPEKLFKNYSKISCWDCEKCNFSSYCNYKELEEVHLRIKKIYSKNMINQFSLKDLFTDK
ncbi:MAG: YcaO-like family protein [Tissierellales bacterium]|jgi:ribosomal protein S12 methylthiotransferase accessory factor|nr:YcaO-like family protein [Tissierellales bacterium]